MNFAMMDTGLQVMGCVSDLVVYGLSRQISFGCVSHNLVLHQVLHRVPEHAGCKHAGSFSWLQTSYMLHASSA